MKKSFFEVVFSSVETNHPDLFYLYLMNVLENEVSRINNLNNSKTKKFYIEGLFEDNDYPVKYVIEINRVEGSDYIRIECLSRFNWFVQINFRNAKHEKKYFKFYESLDHEKRYYRNFLKYPIKLFGKHSELINMVSNSYDQLPKDRLIITKPSLA